MAVFTIEISLDDLINKLVQNIPVTGVVSLTIVLNRCDWLFVMSFYATGFVSSLKYSFVVSYNKQQTDWLQPGRVSMLLAAVCDAHNDNNHSAAVCVKDT